MKATSKSQVFRRLALWTCGLIATLFFAVFVFVSVRIGADVRAVSMMAMRHHPGDHVEALIQYVKDPSQNLRDRNRAVWALGQLGDHHALTVLRGHYSGEPCDHRIALCQRELGKAIKLVDGGVNATAWIWRHSSARRAEGVAETAGQTPF